MEIVQPSSLAAVSRWWTDIPATSRLWASQIRHFSISACQLMTSDLKYGWEGPWIPFLCVRLETGFIEPVCWISRRTDVLRARTWALGWERHRIVADRRHCMNLPKIPKSKRQIYSQTGITDMIECIKHARVCACSLHTKWNWMCQQDIFTFKRFERPSATANPDSPHCSTGLTDLAVASSSCQIEDWKISYAE